MSKQIKQSTRLAAANSDRERKKCHIQIINPADSLSWLIKVFPL